MCSASDEDEKEEVAGTDMEALVPTSCADHTFAVGEVMDVVVAYAVDIGPRVKSYLNRTVVKLKAKKYENLYLHCSCIC